MKLLIFSDLHLEFGNPLRLRDSQTYQVADVVVLAGDIITFKDLTLLKDFLEGCFKPILFVAGNHEYYTEHPMNVVEEKFALFIQTELPNVHWLRNSAIQLREKSTDLDYSVFGGTMWTDFNKSDPLQMLQARDLMNDFRGIKYTDTQKFSAELSVTLHQEFKDTLQNYFATDSCLRKIIISHHSPVEKVNTRFKYSKLTAAFNSLDMIPLIEYHKPMLWIYGHTHESDDQYVGVTRVVSNPYGYYRHQENAEFVKDGLLITL